MNTFRKTILLTLLLVMPALLIIQVPESRAETAAEIDISVDVALKRFTGEVKGATAFLKAAKGILVIPNVKQAGFIVGGEYGEGALVINGKKVAYYNIVAGSLGYQLGVQQKDILLVFMTDEVLDKFRSGENWQAGVDGTVALMDVGAEASIDTATIKSPIVAFVFGQKGLMAGASIKGSKFTKLKK